MNAEETITKLPNGIDSGPYARILSLKHIPDASINYGDRKRLTKRRTFELSYRKEIWSSVTFRENTKPLSFLLTSTLRQSMLLLSLVLKFSIVTTIRKEDRFTSSQLKAEVKAEGHISLINIVIPRLSFAGPADVVLGGAGAAFWFWADYIYRVFVEAEVSVLSRTFYWGGSIDLATPSSPIGLLKKGCLAYGSQQDKRDLEIPKALPPRNDGMELELVVRLDLYLASCSSVQPMRMTTDHQMLATNRWAQET
ncbi:hypothetical protein TWF506_000014 [Arthrobotrys conoides]|uniref:Uncharacterized protein n=1 Tax=Arthrobotrys conoides TaxID=74498 RepID=A0AAN8NCZ7_9PEZI